MPRTLEACPLAVLLLYTPGDGAEARGYEPWLVAVDNPFFNAIPGIRHYANWKVEQVLAGPAPGYTHFDFLGLDQPQDLERVWFDRELDAFRTEWVRLWGYGAPRPGPLQANGFAMRLAAPPAGTAAPWAVVTGGNGPPPAADLVWTFTETLRKHYAVGAGPGPWRTPAAAANPLGLDWLAVRYGPDPAELRRSFRSGTGSLALLARQMAAPAP